MSHTFTSTSRCSSRYLGRERGGQSLGQDRLIVWERRPVEGEGGKTFFLAEGSLPQVRAGDRQTRAGKTFQAKGPVRQDVEVGTQKADPELKR